jgi:hypothetical protein
MPAGPRSWRSIGFPAPMWRYGGSTMTRSKRLKLLEREAGGIPRDQAMRISLDEQRIVSSVAVASLLRK